MAAIKMQPLQKVCQGIEESTLNSHPLIKLFDSVDLISQKFIDTEYWVISNA